MTDASQAELAPRIPCVPQGSWGAPHSGSLGSLRRDRGLRAESQRRFYGYLLSTDSNCRSLLTAPLRTRTLLPEGNNKAFSIQQRWRRQKAAILGPGKTPRAVARMCARRRSREKAVPASRARFLPMAGFQVWNLVCS